MHENFFMTKWWFCLVSRFSVFRTLTSRYWLWWLMMIVNADNTCEIWMRYSTLESQFHHEVHVWDPFVTQFEVFEMFVLCLWDVWEVCFVSLTCLRSLVSVIEMFEKFVLCFWDVFLRCLRRAEIGVQNQSLQKLDRQNALANEKNWQRWIRRIPCLIMRSARPNNCMTNNMARQREQSQDRPMREPFNTTWPTKPAVILKRHDIVGGKKSKDKGGKDWSAKRVGKQQQVTALNLTHSQKRFKQAQRKPKQKYEGHHGTEKGTILRRTSLNTIKAKKRPQSLKWYIESGHDGVGLKKRDDKGGMDSVKWQWMQNLTRDLVLHGWQVQRPTIQPSLW